MDRKINIADKRRFFKVKESDLKEQPIQVYKRPVIDKKEAWLKKMNTPKK